MYENKEVFEGRMFGNSEVNRGRWWGSSGYFKVILRLGLVWVGMFFVIVFWVMGI